MNQATADSLADKIATLDLTEDEATMLAMMIGGRPGDEDDDEVAGFEFKPEPASQGYTEVEWTYVREVVGLKIAPPRMGWSWGETNPGK